MTRHYVHHRSITTVNDVGSCSALGGTVHYQDTISIDKLDSYGVKPKTEGKSSPCPLVPIYAYMTEVTHITL